MLKFELLHPKMTQEMLGLVPSFLDPNNPLPARQQLDVNYQHGGGWRPMARWRFNPVKYTITYPSDETLTPLAKATLRDETIYFYQHAWVCIVQTDGTFEVSRLD